MAFSLKTLISELEKNIVPGMLQENASNLSSYKRRLERLAGILKFQELLKMYPVPVKVVKNENGFHITDCVWKKIELRENLKSHRGLAVSLEIICHNCGESTSTMSSKISNKCYDVNLRLTYGMRAIGKGGATARIFCGLMNLPPPPAKFERHNSLFLNVLKTISENSMNAAVHEAVIANDNNSNIAVAVDGT
ncbi:uncharacterized protein TNCV_4751961 [Trichonephila clavipes]|nr:uncharacterized protein TNCV_4751961 [Trichonephila clavipes]